MGMFRRRETPADDKARTGRLLDALEAAYLARTGDPCGDTAPDTFETVIYTATRAETSPNYPPPGHPYPRR